jgi:hypothetical protein
MNEQDKEFYVEGKTHVLATFDMIAGTITIRKANLLLMSRS